MGISAIIAIVSFAVMGAVKDIQKYKRLSAQLDLNNYKLGLFVKVDSCFTDAIDSTNHYQAKARYWMNEGNKSRSKVNGRR